MPQPQIEYGMEYGVWIERVVWNVCLCVFVIRMQGCTRRRRYLTIQIDKVYIMVERVAQWFLFRLL